MFNGPVFNNIKIDSTDRSNLGIEETINGMQEHLCQAISSQTEYPFYFVFLIWCFYDYKMNVSNSVFDESEFWKYVFRQNYYFSLSFINNDWNTLGVIGSRNIRRKIDFTKNSFDYLDNYIITETPFTYYNSIIINVFHFVGIEELEDSKIKYLKFSNEGINLAKEFEKTMCNTSYFKNNRFDSSIISKDDLIELSNTISLWLTDNESLKKMFIDYFFNYEKLINNDAFRGGFIETKNLVLYTCKKYGVDCILNDVREVLFDYYSPLGYNYVFPYELNDNIKKWELIMGRRYYTTGLSIIFKYILPLITNPLTFDDWFNRIINYYDFDYNVNDNLSSLINKIELTYEDREDTIKKCLKNGFYEKTAIADGFKIILFVYKRFKNRNDLNISHCSIVVSSSDTLPLFDFIDLVDKYLNKPIYEFMQYIILHYLIEQNWKKSQEKLLYTHNNGFHFEKIEDKYVLLKNYSFNLGRDRIVTLTKFMEHLGLLVGDSNE